MTLALRFAVRSDVGLLREGNEDSAYAGPHLLAIADGMGGHAAGEVASAVAISALAGLDDAAPRGDLLESLATAVASANSTLHEMSIEDPSIEGMGTTLTALLWAGPTIAICHIGDSRAYLLRGGEFRQITRDHTLVQSLVDDGRLSPAQAASHPQRSLVMRALQSSTDAEPDLSTREAMAGDRYLLCSDGLSDVVSEETLHKTLAAFTDRDQAVLHLIELANRGGGPDNITCIVADVVDTTTDRAPGQPAVVVGAASNGDGRPRLRTDSPASRAYLLTRGVPRVPATTAGPAGTPARASSRSVTLSDRGRAGPATDARHPGQAGGTAGPDGAGDADDAGAVRRRWPVVTSILVILVIVIVGGGYAAWRYTQNQYYVGTDGEQVVIYRGINEQVAGIGLSSVYQRTGIPMSHVPATDADTIRATTAPGSLATAQRTVQNIRHGYVCQQAYAALRSWQAHRPKPVTHTRIVHGKKVKVTTVPKYRPKPPVPASCPPQGVGGVGG